MGIETHGVPWIQGQARCVRGVTADHPVPGNVRTALSIEMLPGQGIIGLIFKRQVRVHVRMHNAVMVGLVVANGARRRIPMRFGDILGNQTLRVSQASRLLRTRSNSAARSGRHVHAAS